MTYILININIPINNISINNSHPSNATSSFPAQILGAHYSSDTEHHTHTAHVKPTRRSHQAEQGCKPGSLVRSFAVFLRPNHHEVE